LTLYVPAQGELKKVLPPVSLYRAIAEKGCFGTFVEDLAYVEANLTLGMAKSVSNGWADMTVTAKIRSGTNEPPTGKPMIERVTLKYDGRRYRVDGNMPWWLSM
jgi:hypothetical protein